MVIPFTSADIQNMRDAQSIHAYTDYGVYIAPPSLASLDDYGQPTTAGAETPGACAFRDSAKAERWNLGEEIQQLDGEVDFTFITPEKGGRFRIVERFGASVNQVTYEIVGINDRGAYGYVCALRAVSL